MDQLREWLHSHRVVIIEEEATAVGVYALTLRLPNRALFQFTFNEGEPFESAIAVLEARLAGHAA